MIAPAGTALSTAPELSTTGKNTVMYLHGFEKQVLRDINKRPSLGERYEQAETSHWIIKSAVYLQPIKMLILSTELFSMLTIDIEVSEYENITLALSHM